MIDFTPPVISCDQMNTRQFAPFYNTKWCNACCCILLWSKVFKVASCDQNPGGEQRPRALRLIDLYGLIDPCAGVIIESRGESSPLDHVLMSSPETGEKRIARICHWSWSFAALMWSQMQTVRGCSHGRTNSVSCWWRMCCCQCCMLLCVKYVTNCGNKDCVAEDGFFCKGLYLFP